MLTVYIGSTFQLIGVLQQDGAPADFSGWSLSASLFDQAGTTLIAALNVAWLDQTQGLLTLSAPSTDTWPAGKARIDCKAVTPLGDIILGPPTYLRIAQSPLS
jgi:hypothetical protein